MGVWNAIECWFLLNWFRCYHTRCDNRHRILSRWFQLDYYFFLISQSDTALHKIWISENKQSLFFIKINILFFLVWGKKLPLETSVLAMGVWNTIKCWFLLNWFRCYHTRCDNRHRILSRWFQLDYYFFLISQSDTALHKIWISENKQSLFFIKINIIFFLPYGNNIIKSISYEIIQNNQ